MCRFARGAGGGSQRRPNMSYKRNDQLNNYDVFPKVLAAGRETTVHIRALGNRTVFGEDKEYTVAVCELDGGNPHHFPKTGSFTHVKAVCDAEGTLSFTYAFPTEQMYFLRVLEGDHFHCELNVYAVGDDLVGRYPFLGDLHMHTCRSDGSQIPAVVCAEYRRFGYDFTVISDHHRYYPSLEAIEAYRGVPTEMTIVPGEEVHLPPVHDKSGDVHIVNFGGEYSVNGLVEATQIWEKGKDLKYRALRTENVPDVMTQDEYSDELEAYAATLDIPDDIDRIPAAICSWAFAQIKKAGGLAIFAHPNWIENVYHVPEKLTDWLFEKREFDAFEVLGGERYYEQNGFQTARYNDERAKGHRVPIVGSTDSHSCYDTNKGYDVCSTIIFSPENERKALIESVRGFYSVAVDTISKEFRVVGEARFVRYVTFLLQYYFPLHDDLCFEEGRLMKQYATGTAAEKAEALEALGHICGRMKKLREKYFAF